MAKMWYPVIDYLACLACGTCIEKCSHSVYDAARAPSPAVRNPEGCIDHCHGCGDRCPVGAITYVGDDTGWTPPNGNPGSPETCCGTESQEKQAIVDYLYLDLQTCDRCIGTDHVLEQVMLALTPALELAGYKVEFHKVEMESAELAARYRFLSSPTIRVNGQDICAAVEENSCGCCSDISGTEVDCRVFDYHGACYEIPPEEMLAEGILQAVFGTSGITCSCGAYELPDNLKNFYAGRNKLSACTCSGDCC